MQEVCIACGSVLTEYELVGPDGGPFRKGFCSQRGFFFKQDPQKSTSLWHVGARSRKARRAEIEVLAQQAGSLSDSAKRLPVLADTTLLRAFGSGSAAQPACSPPIWRFLLCFTQMWISKSGQAFPPFASGVLEYMGQAMHHPHQMSLAQFSAYHLREVIYNLDMLTIARTTKLTAASKEKAEDETMEDLGGEQLHHQVDTEFYGGEQMQDPEDEELAGSEAWRPRHAFDHDKLVSILARQVEIAAASRKGRKNAAHVQMKIFDARFIQC